MPKANNSTSSRTRSPSSNNNSKTRAASMLPKAELESLSARADRAGAVSKERHAVHVALHPRYLGNLALGLVQHFNELTGQFHPKLNGILMGYGKLYLKSPDGVFLNDAAHIHVDVISDFFVFRPAEGAVLAGRVVKKSPTHVSCLVHGCFNVSCYMNDEAAWDGASVGLDQVIRVRVEKTDMAQRIPFIRGAIIKEAAVEEDATSTPLMEEVGSEAWDEMNKKSSKKRKKQEAHGMSSSSADESATASSTTADPPSSYFSSKKKKRNKDKEERLQNSLLESVESKFKKSKQKDREVEETAAATTPKRKGKKSKESVSETPKTKNPTSELQKSLLASAESKFATPAAASTAKKARRSSKSGTADQEASYSRQELEDMLDFNSTGNDDSIGSVVNGDATTPKSSKKKGRKSMAAMEVEVKQEPPSMPESKKRGRKKKKREEEVIPAELVQVKVEEETEAPPPSKKRKKGLGKKAHEDMQNALISNMLAKMPSKKKKT